MSTISLKELTDIGQGFTWHLDEHPALMKVVDDVREGLLVDGAEPGDSPFLPEGAVALAERVLRDLGDAKKIVALDMPATVIEALACLGHEVTALADAVPVAAYEGVAGRRGVAVQAYPLADPLPEASRETFDLAVADVLRHPTAVVPLVSRALAALKVGGRVAFTLHPLQRSHLKACAQLLPATRTARHDESCARLIASAGTRGPTLTLSDFPWDLWVGERSDQDFTIKPTARLGAEDREAYDPGFLKHGTVELHDVDEAVTPEELDAGMAAAVERAGLAVVGEGALDREGYLHRFRALDEGGHVALALDRAAGVLSLEFYRWSPWLEVKVVSALLDHLPRKDGAVRFGGA